MVPGPRRKFDPDPSELRRLYQTMSMRAIAEHFGVGETVVFHRIREHGIVLDGFEKGGHRKRTGRQFSEAHKLALRRSHAGNWTGEKNPNWRGGVDRENRRLRGSEDYQRWRIAALARAGNACEGCGVKNGTVCECCGTKIRLHVHHIESFSAVPERRFDPANSEVLCPRCHDSRHHGKSGELLETPTGVEMAPRAISSQAAHVSRKAQGRGRFND